MFLLVDHFFNVALITLLLDQLFSVCLLTFD